MSNVVRLRDKVSPERSSAPATNRANIAELASRAMRLQSCAKVEIHRVITLLDLAAQQARELTAKIGDPDIRGILDRHVTSVEHTLHVARERVLEL
jgi:hypothetical protein